MAGRRFRRELERRRTSPEGRRWSYVPYDQLTDALGPLSREDPAESGIVLIENPWKAGLRPYHKQKLALVLANQRQFALEQAARGVAVRYVVSNGPYRAGLAPLIRELGPLRVMRPAERELREDLRPLVDQGGLEVSSHEAWLTTREQFERSRPERGFRMDAFYRLVRRESGILMQGTKPLGGKFSFDAENRQPWRGEPPAPAPPEFEPDEITVEVLDLVRRRFDDHPGALVPAQLPATARDATVAWQWAKRECMDHFGPYEDAMSARSTTLFHTRISALLNLCRLTPARVVDDVLELDVPLACKEGFVRQVLGWREFVRHVHEATDGFRSVPIAETDNPLPAAYWGERSGLGCLDHVVGEVLEGGYSHHITRLMVLSNVATLLDLSPRELTDWFWSMYVDAFDWVVEPNVLGMGTFAAGALMTTKPYVSGAGYIDRMSDYCRSCSFDPKRDCPLTPLYWAYLERHREELKDNPRMRLPLASAARREPAKRNADAAVYDAVSRGLAAGRRLRPGDDSGCC